MDSARRAPGGRGRLDDAPRLVVAVVPDARVDRPSAVCRASNSCAVGRDDRGCRSPRRSHRARQGPAARTPPPVGLLSIYRGAYPAAAIIINTTDRLLYLVPGNSLALRYGIGVGCVGFQWGGVHVITRKPKWSDWTPPPEMIARQPSPSRFLAGRPDDPLGPRALFNISAKPSIGSTAPMRRARTVARSRPAIFAW